MLLYFYVLTIITSVSQISKNYHVFSKLATIILGFIVVYTLLKQSFSLELLTFEVGQLLVIVGCLVCCRVL